MRHEPDVTKRQDSYRIIRMRGRPVIAIPAASRRVRLSAAQRYQGTTRKRAVFQRALRCAIALGIDGQLGSKVDSPLDVAHEPDAARFCFGSWLSKMRSTLDAPTAAAVAVWPPQVDRGRIYIHLLAPDGAPIAFAKISLDTTNDRFLSVEAETLRELQTMSLGECHPPRLLADGTHGGHRYVVMQPLPQCATPIAPVHDVYPTDCVAEFAGRSVRLTFEQVSQLDWWQTFRQSREEHDLFAGELKSLVQDGLEVCRVHGDLGPGNLTIDVTDNRLWLFDWEQSHRQGPKQTDPVNFFLAVEQPNILADPSQALRRFADRFLSDGSNYVRQDVMAALAYLHTVRINTASMLIDRWHELTR